MRLRSYSCGVERSRAEVPAELGQGEGAPRVGTSGATEGTNEHLVEVVGVCPMPSVLDGGRVGFLSIPAAFHLTGDKTEARRGDLRV